MKFINGISEVYNNYDYYIIDLWGVLHDGHDPYKGAVNALKTLEANGKKIVLLSNAPRRSVKAEAVLNNLGFTKDMYDMLLTSGEATFHYLKNNIDKFGKKYFYIGPEKDRDLLSGTEFVEVDSADKANFALATGFENFGSLFSEKQHQLDASLKNNLPLIVANPDKKVVKQTGEEYICSGLMGEYYIEKGGKVIWFGKPHKAVYDECLEFFKTKDTSKILCIGDSLHTDVAGANNIGAGSLFVTGGIHRQDVFVNGKFDNSHLQDLIVKEKQTPRYVIDEFRW